MKRSGCLSVPSPTLHLSALFRLSALWEREECECVQFPAQWGPVLGPGVLPGGREPGSERDWWGRQSAPGVSWVSISVGEYTKSLTPRDVNIV